MTKEEILAQISAQIRTIENLKKFKDQLGEADYDELLDIALKRLKALYNQLRK